MYTPVVLGVTISPPTGLAGAAIGGIIAQKSLERIFDLMDGVND